MALLHKLKVSITNAKKRLIDVIMSTYQNFDIKNTRWTSPGGNTDDDTHVNEKYQQGLKKLENLRTGVEDDLLKPLMNPDLLQRLSFYTAASGLYIGGNRVLSCGHIDQNEEITSDGIDEICSNYVVVFSGFGTGKDILPPWQVRKIDGYVPWSLLAMRTNHLRFTGSIFYLWTVSSHVMATKVGGRKTTLISPFSSWKIFQTNLRLSSKQLIYNSLFQ